MNVNSFITKDYRKKDDFAVQKNKANTKPIKANLPEGKIDAKCVVTKDYERNDIFAVPENKPNQTQSNPIQTQSRNNSRATDQSRGQAQKNIATDFTDLGAVIGKW